MEFNRAAMRTVGRCSPDLGHAFGAGEFLDYYLNTNLRWGIEIARESAVLLHHVIMSRIPM